MSDGEKRISGLWFGGLELIMFLLVAGAAAIPLGDNYNHEESMAITLAMGAVGLILVGVLNQRLKKRTFNRAALTVTQQSVLVVRDRSVALSLFVGAILVGASIGTATLVGGQMQESLVVAAVTATLIVFVCTAILSCFWGCFHGAVSVGGGILALLVVLTSLYWAGVSWDFSATYGQFGLEVNAVKPLIQAGASFFVLSHIVTAFGFGIGTKILFTGSSSDRDHRGMISMLAIGYVLLGIATLLGPILLGGEMAATGTAEGKVAEAVLKALGSIGGLPVICLYFINGLALKRAADELTSP